MSESHDLGRLVQLLKGLADESRLKLLGLLANEERSVATLAELVDLTVPTVSHHLAKLRELDLVQVRVAGTTHLYQLNRKMLQQVGRELVTPERVAAIGADVSGDAWEQRVLRTFLVDGQLTKIPEKRRTRAVILRWLVAHFEPDTRYPEPQLNAILKRFHPDCATLRREFIAEQLMERENGMYWRVPLANS